MKTRILPLVALLASFSSAALAHSTAAPSSGNPYGVAIRINDQVITNFELDQRILLLKAFGSTGNLKKLAQEQLIDDRLRLQAASLAGLEVTEEELQEGITEFAARGNLTGEQLLQYLAARGAAPESMRDFVRAGVVWRTVVRSRFGAKANISDSELDSTLNLATNQVQESVLVSEIQIPLRDGSSENALELAERLSKTITS